MLDFEVTGLLYEVGSYYAALGEKYRARAFERGALTLDGFGHFIDECVENDCLTKLPGVGRSVLACVNEIRSTGRLLLREELSSRLAPYVAEVSKVPYCGARVLQILATAGFDSLERLLEGISSSELMLSKRVERALIRYAQESDPESDVFIGIPFPVALAIAGDLRADLKDPNLELCGEARMLCDRVRHLEFLTTEPEIRRVKQLLREHRFALSRPKARHDSVRTLLYPGIHCTIHVVSPSQKAFALFRHSSPASHFEDLVAQAKTQGLSLEDDGLHSRDTNLAEGLESERQLYALLETPWIPPELRHLPLETAKGIAERLVSPARIRGDFHVHTTWSDGIDALETMAERAASLGYEYLGIAEHSESLKVAHGLPVPQLFEQTAEIDNSNAGQRATRLLKGIEVEIDTAGQLDYPPEVLSQLDFVIAAVHTNTRMSREEMTARVLRAVRNPYVHVLAHPTGRLTSRPGNFFVGRDGWEMDFDRVARACARHHVALEINAFPERMDLSAERVQLALKHGAKVAISSDAHSAYHLLLLKYGVQIARRGGAAQSDVLNTLAWHEGRKYLHGKPVQQTAVASESHSNQVQVLRRTFEAPSMEHTFAERWKEDEYPGVVGIDLTASEKRKTGWALLKSATASTSRLRSDEEIIGATLDTAPNVVSIDSPLALPYGRCCAKEDCQCRRYGITRFCERFLMANGIGVFPCLLPSMVGLTMRGIRLKKALEERGVAVIESYPGAAQDILGIPRKKRGVEYLYDGLKRFGLRFEPAMEQISHDELDAVTSALVGYFYLSNQYLGLGDERENFLVIPSIQSFESGSDGPCVIAVAGETGAGKTTVALRLALKYGFRYVRYSQIIAELAGLVGAYDKAELQEAGLVLHKKMGQQAITRRLIAGLPRDAHVVIDGMRFMDDFLTLKDHFGERFFPFFVECSRSTLVKRLKKTPFLMDCSKSELDRMLSHEVERESVVVGFQIPDRIVNNGSYKELFEQVNHFLRTLKLEGGKQCLR